MLVAKLRGNRSGQREIHPERKQVFHKYIKAHTTWLYLLVTAKPTVRASEFFWAASFWDGGRNRVILPDWSELALHKALSSRQK